MECVYHYMPTVESMALQAFESDLSPVRPVVQKVINIGFALGEDMSEAYRFCFLGTPEPELWKESGHLDALKGRYDSGASLISFDVDPEEAYIFDAKPTHDISKLLGTDPSSPRPSMLKSTLRILPNHSRIRSLLKDYFATKQKLSDYLSSGTEYEYPEVATQKVVPFDEINWLGGSLEGFLEPVAQA